MTNSMENAYQYITLQPLSDIVKKHPQQRMPRYIHRLHKVNRVLQYELPFTTQANSLIQAAASELSMLSTCPGRKVSEVI